jgi:hypothetical protein
MRFTLVFFLLIIPICLAAQLNNEMFEQRNLIHESDSNTLSFNLRTLGYNKNNEYFSKIADGYTLFGYQINPSISYQPTKHTKFDIGLYAQKDFGNNEYSEVAPTFSFSYLMGDAKLVFGTLEGSLSHRLIEPIYDFEKVMVDRLENGIQLVIDNNWLFFDAWLDWQKMLYTGQNDQEELVGGVSMNYILMDKNVKISIPLQLLVKHIGGQIDSSPLPLQTYTNTAYGIILDFHNPDINFIEHLKFDSYYVQYNDFSGEQRRPFQDGSGVYLNMEVRTKFKVEMMVSYWKGHEFLSIQGGQLYPSESSSFKNLSVIEDSRELLILRLMHNLKIADNLTLSSRFEPYFDLINNRFDFSHAFYLNYNTDFRLLKKSRH